MWLGIGVALLSIGSGIVLATGTHRRVACQQNAPQTACPVFDPTILDEPPLVVGAITLGFGLVGVVLAGVSPQRSLRFSRSTQQVELVRLLGSLPVSRKIYPSSIVKKLSVVRDGRRDGAQFKAIMAVGDSILTLAEGPRYAVADMVDEVQRLFGFPVQTADAEPMPYRGVSVKATLQTPFHIGSMAVSPDGQWLAVGGVFRSDKGDKVSKPGTLQIWNLQTRQVHKTLPGIPEGVSHVVFSPDSRRLAAPCTSEAIALHDVATGATIQHLAIPRKAIHNQLFTFTPDGDSIVFAGEGDRPTAKPGSSMTQRFITHISNDPHLAQQWDLSTNTLRDLLKLKGIPTALALSPDGHYLAVGYFAEKLRVFHVRDQAVLTAIDYSEQVTSIVFSPDSHYVLYGSDCAGAMNYPQVGIYDITQMTSRKALQPSRTAAYAIRCLEISPDGRVVALAQAHSRETEIRLVDFESGDVLNTLKLDNPVKMMKFSPDGRSLLTVSKPQAIDIWQ